MNPVPTSVVRAGRSPKVRWSVPVFVELHAWLDTTEYRSVPAWRIAQMMAIDECTVYRAIRTLHANGFLERGPRLGNAYTFRIASKANDSAQATLAHMPVRVASMA